MQRGTLFGVLMDIQEFTRGRRKKWLESRKYMRRSEDRVKLRRHS